MKHIPFGEAADARVRALIISDTHLGKSRDLVLPAEIMAAARRADVILHAGDILTDGLLERLKEVAPTHAVLGNNDLDLVGELPERLELQLAGVRVAMVHDSGAALGRETRLARWFPNAQLVIFGHSHQPYDRAGFGGQRLLNPGSPTERRRAPTHTYGWVELADGAVRSTKVIDLPR